MRAPANPALPATDTPRPVLPSETGEPPQHRGSPAEVFSTEVRDVRWAEATEHAIEKRLDKLGAARLQTECHQTQCKLVIDGDEKSVSKAIATMESTTGLQGFASSIFLTAPEPRPDGTLVLRVFATFTR